MSASLYLGLARQLDSKRAELTAPLRLSPEPEMATEYQLSRDTVRRALKLLEGQGAVTRRRGRGTYLQPLMTRIQSLAGKTIGLVPPWWADSTSAWFTSIVFEGVSRWAETHGCAISVLHTEPAPATLDQWLQQVRQRQLSGLLWVHPQARQMPLVERCAKMTPTVVVGRYYPDRGLHHVSPDYQQAARLIDRHFAHKQREYALLGRSALEDYTRIWIEAADTAQAERGAKFDYRRHFIDFHNFTSTHLPQMLLDYYLPFHSGIRAFVLLTSSYLRYLLADTRFREGLSQGQWEVAAFDFGLQPIDSYWPGHNLTHVTCDWVKIGQRAIGALEVLASGGQLSEILFEPVELRSSHPALPHPTTP